MGQQNVGIRDLDKQRDRWPKAKGCLVSGHQSQAHFCIGIRHADAMQNEVSSNFDFTLRRIENNREMQPPPPPSKLRKKYQINTVHKPTVRRVSYL